MQKAAVGPKPGMLVKPFEVTVTFSGLAVGTRDTAVANRIAAIPATTAAFNRDFDIIGCLK